MSITRELFKTTTYPLEEWGITLKLVQTPDVRKPEDMWFVVTPLCEHLGVVAARQRQRIKADTINYGGFWRELPVRIEWEDGYRRSLCLRMAKIGRFFDDINPNKANPRFAGKLALVRASAERAAAKTLLGEHAEWIVPEGQVSGASPGTPAPTPALASARAASTEPKARVVRKPEEIQFTCEHGTNYLIVIDEKGEVHVVKGSEVDTD